MRPGPKGIVGILKEAFRGYGEDKVARLAAALSYYTIFSIAPLLVLVIAVTGFVIGSNAAIRGQILSEVQRTAGAQAAGIVDELIANNTRERDGIIATAVGIVTLIFGATGVFLQLKDALNTIWEVAPKTGRGVKGILRDRLAGLVMVLGLGFVLLVALVVSTALSVMNAYFASRLGGWGGVALVINYALQVAIVTLIFSAILKVLPDVDVRWRHVWPGGLLTAVLFLIGQYLISLYLSKASPASAYGAAGSLVVILLWVYYSAQILFFGAEFTKAYTRAQEAVVLPSENARYITPEERAQEGIAREEDLVSTGAVPETREDERRAG